MEFPPSKSVKTVQSGPTNQHGRGCAAAATTTPTFALGGRSGHGDLPFTSDFGRGYQYRKPPISPCGRRFASIAISWLAGPSHALQPRRIRERRAFWKGVWPGRGKDVGTQDPGPRTQGFWGREGGRGPQRDRRRRTLLTQETQPEDCCTKLRRCKRAEEDPSVGRLLGGLSTFVLVTRGAVMAWYSSSICSIPCLDQALSRFQQVDQRGGTLEGPPPASVLHWRTYAESKYRSEASVDEDGPEALITTKSMF
ncbi:hypothetical protein LA080_005072 [Diaporthe eres]|nr:hypothetical protein LA080_005072 [Diaporthe eres]